MGSDVGQSKIPLIKTMQMGENKLLIPGSSLKGAVRSVYEAITNSTLGVVTPKYKKGYRNHVCLAATKRNSVQRVEFLGHWIGRDS